jgi:F0F1-type ATP synthase membrane subunit a
VKLAFFSALFTLSVLEFGVALIQAYVFTRLRSLYLSEVNSPNL